MCVYWQTEHAGSKEVHAPTLAVIKASCPPLKVISDAALWPVPAPPKSRSHLSACTSAKRVGLGRSSSSRPSLESRRNCWARAAAAAAAAALTGAPPHIGLNAVLGEGDWSSSIIADGEGSAEMWK